MYVVIFSIKYCLNASWSDFYFFIHDGIEGIIP